jgi:anti-anti-sigma factor
VTEKRQKERSRIHPGQSFPAVSSGQSVFLLPLFAISAAEDGDTYVIRVAGELDLSGCPRLEHALREAEVSHAIRILLDLDELTFIDAAGLSVLVAAWHHSMTDSNRLQVTPGRGSVASMFRLTALDLVLPFSPPGPVRAQSKEQNP